VSSDKENGTVAVKDQAGAAEPAVIDGKVPLKAKDLDQFLRTEGEAEGDPEGGAYLRIIDQVLSATSPDVVLTPVEALNAADMVGIPLLLFGGELNKSDYDVGSPFYVSLECVVNEDQTPAIVNCGHKKVIAQFVKLREFGQFPYRVMFRQRGVSKIGGTPMLELVKWEEPEAAPF